MKKRHINFILGLVICLIFFLIYWFTGYNRFGSTNPRGLSELIDFICNKPLNFIFILFAGGFFGAYLNIFPFGKD